MVKFLSDLAVRCAGRMIPRHKQGCQRGEGYLTHDCHPCRWWYLTVYSFIFDEKLEWWENKVTFHWGQQIHVCAFQPWDPRDLSSDSHYHLFLKLSLTLSLVVGKQFFFSRFARHRTIGDFHCSTGVECPGSLLCSPLCSRESQILDGNT